MIYNYRKLLSERAFLKVHERAKRLKANGTQLFNIEYSRGRLQFKTRSATDPAHITYTQTIDVTECTPEGIRGLKYNSIKDLLMKSGLKIHCNCCSWHYWGYKYMAWKRGYGIQKEVRFPYIRNPHEKGYLCKHLFFVLSIFPFITPQVASKMGKYMQGKDTGSLGASFGQTRRDKEALIKEYESTGLRHSMTLEEAGKRGELDRLTPYYEKKFGLQKSDSVHEIISDAVDDAIEDEMEEMDYMIDEIDETFEENGFGEDEIRDSISNQSDGEGSLT